MNRMNIPGFTAQASLDETDRYYHKMGVGTTHGHTRSATSPCLMYREQRWRSGVLRAGSERWTNLQEVPPTADHRVPRGRVRRRTLAKYVRRLAARVSAGAAGRLGIGGDVERPTVGD